jgi:hypothetical protein
MRKQLLVGVLGFAAVLVLTPSAGWAVPATGPQPLQGSCNAGTANARGNTPTEARDFVPHFHDFDLDGIVACYHANPTYPPASPALE